MDLGESGEMGGTLFILSQDPLRNIMILLGINSRRVGGVIYAVH